MTATATLAAARLPEEKHAVHIEDDLLLVALLGLAGIVGGFAGTALALWMSPCA